MTMVYSIYAIIKYALLKEKKKTSLCIKKVLNTLNLLLKQLYITQA